MVIAVVGQRLPFHEDEQGGELPHDLAAFAANELGHIGVFFLRHDAGAGTKGIGQVDEGEGRRHPVDELLRQARQVHGNDRQRRQHFEEEIAVGDGVETVFGHGIEAELPRHVPAIDGKGGARQGRRPQGQDIDPLAGIGQARGIAAEHFDIGHAVMAEGDGLRYLQVRKAGQQGVGFPLCQVDENRLQLAQQGKQTIDGAAGIEAHVGSDLVVTRTPGVQLFAGIANESDQAAFDVHVDVFEAIAESEMAAFDLRADLY